MEKIQGWKNINPIKKRVYSLKFYLAKQYSRLVPASKIVAITGSLGKSTAAGILYSILSSKMAVKKLKQPFMQSPLDNFLDSADSLLKVSPKTEKAIFELGLSNVAEVDNLKEFIRFSTLVITQISDFKESFPDLAEKYYAAIEELVRLLPEEGSLILNWEDPQIRRLSDKLYAKSGVVFFGFDEKTCHVWASKKRIENFQTIFELNCGVERVEIRSNLLGFHQIIPMLAASAAAINMGFSLIAVKKGIEKFEPFPGRMDVVSGLNNSVIIDDTYDGDAKAFFEALQTINLIPARRRIVVIGELEADVSVSEKIHTQIAREIYSNKIDLVLLGSGQAKFIEEELIKLGFIQERMLSGLQNPAIVSNLVKILGKGDVVLIKGHPSLRLSEVVKRVSKAKR